MAGRFVVTGANGYLGGEICLELKRCGHEPIGVARKGRNVERLRAAGISCHHYEQLSSVLSSGDTIGHCAGKVGSNRSWADFKAVNVDWTSALFKTAVAQEAGCFVYVSSVAAIGYKNRKCIDTVDETTTADLLPGELYGRSKLEAEENLLELAKPSSCRLVILRPGLIYGKRPFGRRQTWFHRGITFDSQQRMPLSHITNFVHAIEATVAHDNAKGVYFVVDEEQPSLARLNREMISQHLLQYPPWQLGTLGFWTIAAVRSMWRTLRRRSVCCGYTHAQHAFATRRLKYSTKRLRSDTGWVPRISLQEGLETCTESCSEVME